MAITAPKLTTDFASGFLKPEMSGYIFEKAAKSSVVMGATNRVPLGINGQEIPVVTGKMTANWVAQGGQKPASHGAIGLKTISPKKLAAITVVSAETVRANPGNYMNIVRDQIAEAFAVAFDAAALHGTSTPFGQYLDQTTRTQQLGDDAATTGTGSLPTWTSPATVYGDFAAAKAGLIKDGKFATGYLLDDRFEILLDGALDTTGRPLFHESPYTGDASANGAMASADVQIRHGRMLGRPTTLAPGVYADGGTTEIYGYCGDWTQAVWGAVGGISYSVSTEATVTINGVLTSLWENNLVAILAEAEYGFLVNDTDSFVKFVNTTTA